MAALDFPNSPAVGDLWPQPPVAGQPVYRWDGEKWSITSTYGFSPPDAPSDGTTYGRRNAAWVAAMPLKGVIASSTDLNTITAAGVYYCADASCTNGPTSGGQWYIEVAPGPAGYLLQRATSMLADATQYMRVLLASAWQSWISISGSSVIGQIEMWPLSAIPSGRLKCNGASYTRSTYAALSAFLVKSGAATFTNGSPNVGMPAHNLSPFDPVKLFTTGGLPTGFTAGTHGLITAGTIHYVKTVVDANTVTLSATAGGSAITAGSAGSGVHTWVVAPHGDGDGATTFTVPELRGEFPRFWDDSRGVDALRSLGIAQADAGQGHIHPITFPSPSWFVTTGGGSNGTGSSNTIVSAGATIGGPSTDGTNGTPRVAAETRSRNIALTATIRYAA